ncbi:NAD(P)-binding protein [Hypoxylon sp. FL1284]|nr:NAD(P)-binding protein [Hypoxylon sp. FL1284]
MSQGNYIKKVAIVGATGTVGSFIVKELLDLGKHEVTAVTRKDSTAVMPTGVKVAKVDYDDQSSLEAALAGQDVLIITMSVRATSDPQLKLVRAAAAAKVKFVLPNEWGTDMGDDKMANDVGLAKVERPVKQLVEELGASSWIGVVTGFWYEYSLGFGAETWGMDWKNRTWTFMDDGETRQSTITWPQSGRAVAALLSLPIEPEKPGSPSLSDYKNKYIYVNSFTLSQREMFASVLRVTGTKESDWTITHEESAARHEEAQKRLFGGDPTAFPKFLYSRLWFKDGAADFESRRGVANGVLGLPKEDLDAATRIAVDRNEKGLQYH